MERDIIKIDEELCNGCGLCVPNCHEGALRVIDGKVRLVSELMCDGLGACIGYCPEGAITIERRDAESYDEIAVIEEMAGKGSNTVIAHLRHLKDHHEYGYLEEGMTWLEVNSKKLPFSITEVLAAVSGKIVREEDPDPALAAKGMSIADGAGHGQDPHGEPPAQRADGGAHREHPAQGAHGGAHRHHGGGCPGSAERIMTPAPAFAAETAAAETPSQLTHWPVQMHLVNPNAPAYRGADLLLAADCVAFSLGSFHNSWLKGRTLAIACPKLDHGTETYIEKLRAMVDVARVNTITVMMMEVPCCGGLVQMVRTALAGASRKVPVRTIMVSIDGKILKDEWL
ncbi:MAG: 4Fe-4S binding protein [Bacteroidales bacterium]|nr:4Fe-4S binding protein [Bacteroidales bacterium]MDT8372519.1 4Fe-4S binding protein [Bacteroidales bacterium]